MCSMITVSGKACLVVRLGQKRNKGDGVGGGERGGEVRGEGR